MSKVKDALKAYKTAAYDAAAEIDKIRRIYREEEAERLVSEVKNRLQAKKAEADAVFSAEIDAGDKRAAEWAKLDGEKITTDAKLLDFDLEPSEYEELVDRYKDNGTMSRLLFKYGEKKNAAEQGKPNGKYYAIHAVPTRETKAYEYAAEARQAQGIADSLTIERGYMQGVGSPMVEESYENFMKNA